jgi:hypothetical protein
MHVDTVYCDLAKAFDSANHDTVVTKLRYLTLKDQRLIGICLT